MSQQVSRNGARVVCAGCRVDGCSLGARRAIGGRKELGVGDQGQGPNAPEGDAAAHRVCVLQLGAVCQQDGAAGEALALAKRVDGIQPGLRLRDAQRNRGGRN
eukprot:XP_001708777.1 Hypothetical protein GL50803_36693 [Giardia lamblia ATCC 50803]